MANVFLIVEGPTEEQFYRKTLQDYFRSEDGSFLHYLQVVQMPSKRNTTSRGKKGGRVTFAAAIDNVKRFLTQASHCQLVVLILDYYGLHSTFLDHLSSDHNALDDRVRAIQDRLENEINHPRFRFRLQIHEFEAYLFSDPQAIVSHFSQPEKLQDLERILSSFTNDPEQINNSPETAPSKRLENHFPKFGKITDGLVIATKIGIPKIREHCFRFNAMIQLIEGGE